MNVGQSNLTLQSSKIEAVTEKLQFIWSCARPAAESCFQDIENVERGTMQYILGSQHSI